MPIEKGASLLSVPATSYGGRIVRYFDKTPKTIVCPHFWELNWAYGCPFECAYCYLQGTFRGNKEPRPIRLKRVFSALEKVFGDGALAPSIFNTGELADSLMDPAKMEKIVDKFEEQDKHKLLILSKSSNVGFLLRKPRRQTIVSFSINAPKVAGLWEKKTAPSERRIKAAKAVAEAGYETRVRIDPMFPVKGWEKLYCDLVEQIFNAFEPERITLGTIRGLWSTIKYCNDKSWTKYLGEEKTGWGKKAKLALRLSMYSVVLNYLKEKKGFSKIALCKETPEIWKKLRMDPGKAPNWKKCRCNCVW